MIGAQAAEGAVSAWRILRLHPDYRKAWRAVAAGTSRAHPGSIPIRRQTEADLAAAAWGLLAWEDPLADGGPASPFWANAPMAEGMQGRKGTPSFASLAEERGAALSGLLLEDGALILKVERDGAAGQVRIEDGAAFDLDGGLGLDLSGDLEFLSLQLTRAGDLRALLAGEEDAEGCPSPGPWRASSCSPSRAS